MISYKIVVQNQEEYDAEINSNPDICKVHHRSGTCKGDPDCSLDHLQLENAPTIVIKKIFRPTVDGKAGEVSSGAAEGDKVHKPSTDDKHSSGDGEKEKQANDEFMKFYDDVIVKLRAAGPIITFKCCANLAENIQGNVYVTYENHMYASLALAMYNGFYYNGRSMKVEFSPVVDWKRAVCKEYFNEGGCPRGKDCSCLHVLSNPRDEYRDFRDDHEMMFPQTYLKFVKPVKTVKTGKSEEVVVNDPDAQNEMNASIEKKDDTKEVLAKNSGNGESNGAGDQRYFHPPPYDLILNEKQKKKKDKGECQFYSKMKCCKFGPRCSKYHEPAQDDSTLILIKNFFNHPRLRPEDINEFASSSEEELNEAYVKFYDAVYGKFSAIGEIAKFRCCRNLVHHLRGTLYIQYADREAAVEAVNMFNGTMYGTKKLIVDFIPKIKWVSAICGLFAEKKCPRNDECNFLHIFRNPNEYRPYASNDPISRLCKSYSFSGVCGFADRCTQQHPVPERSKLVLVPNFFQHPQLDKESMLDDETYQAYKTFYDDFIGIFRGIGPVLMCKCLLNRVPHLRGNFYVQYSSHEHAVSAVKLLETQDVDAKLCYQIDWPNALCDSRHESSTGTCNFMHAFRNPRGEYTRNVPFSNDRIPYSSESKRSSSMKESRRDPGSRINDDDRRSDRRGRESDRRKSDGDRRKSNDQRRKDDDRKRSEGDSRKRRHPHTKSPRRNSRPIDGNEYIIHVTKLPRKLKSEDIRKLFSAYEGIKDVDIPESNSGNTDQFSAFLVFENKALAEKVHQTVHMVDGQPLRLDGFSAMGDAGNDHGRSSSPVPKGHRSHSSSHGRRSSSSRTSPSGKSFHR